jgi:cytoskeletal protein CcmA (bactofilin family)
MWKKEDVKTQEVPENSTMVVPAVPSGTSSVAPRETNSSLPVSPGAAACISHGIRIKGEVTGSEDLFIDGHLEGKLNLGNSTLTVGREKIQLWSTGNVAGDLQTERLTIEDGAVLRGKVEIETGKPIRALEARAAAAATTSSLASAIPGSAAI